MILHNDRSLHDIYLFRFYDNKYKQNDKLQNSGITYPRIHLLYFYNDMFFHHVLVFYQYMLIN